jgi:hypothetical protein
MSPSGMPWLSPTVPTVRRSACGRWDVRCLRPGRYGRRSGGRIGGPCLRPCGFAAVVRCCVRRRPLEPRVKQAAVLARGLVALANEGQGHVAADVGEGLDGQVSHLAGAQTHHAAPDGDRVVRWSKGAGGGQVAGVLQDGEHLAAVQLPGASNGHAPLRASVSGPFRAPPRFPLDDPCHCLGRCRSIPRGQRDRRGRGP